MKKFKPNQQKIFVDFNYLVKNFVLPNEIRQYIRKDVDILVDKINYWLENECQLDIVKKAEVYCQAFIDNLDEYLEFIKR